MDLPVRTSTRTLKDFGSRKVLIIDDDQDLLMSFKEYFEMEAYQVLTARNGMEALEVLARLAGPHGFPGIVITDLKMPVMDGLEFLARCLNIDADLPVILISAFGEIAIAVEAMRTGAYDFIERPFDVAALVAKVGRALEKRRLVMALPCVTACAGTPTRV